MQIQEAIVETTEYRLVLVLPDSRKVLATSAVEGYRLPTISIPQWTRPAEQLQKAIKAEWDVHVIVLDFLPSSETSLVCAVAEVLVAEESSDLTAIEAERLQIIELQEQQQAQLKLMLAGGSGLDSPFSHIGWIDEAILWLESETGKTISSKGDIEQYNAGGAFALVRFHTEDHHDYWLKATGEPNAHEPSVTRFLSTLCGDYLPEIVSSRPAWNAWLMSGEAVRVDELPKDPFQLFTLLEDAVGSMAELQMKTQGCSTDLLCAGAFDQGMQVFQKHSVELFDYLEEAMNLQTSTKAPRLEKKRLLEIRTILEKVCERMEDLGISETIVHGDLNQGNILTGVGHCQFIDWSEAYLGNPLISLQHLLLLNKVGNVEVRDFINLVLKKRYLDVWTDSCDTNAVRKGFAYMPMLAVASTLYGRGNWLSSLQRNDPRRQEYARSLARHMDLAAQEPILLEALCQ